jgi:hypothetical protein
VVKDFVWNYKKITSGIKNFEDVLHGYLVYLVQFSKPYFYLTMKSYV